MATPAGVLNILVRANTASANLGLAKVNAQARMTAGRFGDLDKATSKTSDRFRRIGKAASVAAGGGLLLLAAAGKKAFDEWEESEKVTKQTEAVIKSTGSAAKVTAKQIEELANQVSLKSGIDDEAIQSGENLLLTFTKIRNETGKGNDIFNQATKVITDMSVSLDQDLKSSAIQVGKALNDPTKGITALQRVGVSFTQKQKDMVAGWVEHGKQLKAQKFILAELTKEFGGSAAAQATGTAKLRVAWDNLFEQFGKTFGPTLEKVANHLAKFFRQMQNGKGAGGDFMRVINELVVSFKHFFQWVGNAIHNIDRFGDGTRRVIFAIGRWFSDTFNDIKRIFGNVMAFIFRKFATLFDIASHLPGIGGKFGDLRDKANKFADSVDKAGEKTDELRGEIRKLHGKELDIKVNLLLNDPATKRLVPLPRGGPGLQDHVQDVATKRGKKWALSHLDEIAPLLGAPGNAPGTLGLWEQIGHRMGLITTSGYRPGDPGFHGQNRARDLSGSAGAMLQYARFMYNRFGTAINELIHTPLGVGIDNHHAGPLTSLYPASTLADHYDHVHVALAKGGTATRKVRALVGEEGPEIVDLPVGAKVHSFSQSKRMVAAMGGLLPGFAGGGTIGLGGLKNLWVKAGGNPAVRTLMAHIAQAESRGDPNAHNPSGASGLWQILGQLVPGNIFNPLVNARNAVAKYRSGGVGPWAASHAGWAKWENYRDKGAGSTGGRGTPEDAPAWNWVTMGNHMRSVVTLGGAKLNVSAKRFANLVHRGEINWSRTKHLRGDRLALKRFPGPPKRVKIPHDPAGAREGFMGAFGAGIDARQALAALTPEFTDDIAVAQDAVRGWQAWLDLAKAKHDQAGITTAATNLKQWQDTLADLLAPATDTQVDDSGRAALLQQLLTEANLRTGVSQAQYGVFRGMPAVGGPSFASGGTVSPTVNVHVADGMSWLRQFIRTEVGQSRVSRGPLPGRGGGLQR